MQASSITTTMRADDGFDRSMLRWGALAGLIGTVGIAAADEVSRHYGLGLELAGVGPLPLATAAAGTAALWAGLVWRDLRRAARSIAGRTTAPAYSPRRRSLHGSSQAGRYRAAPAALKIVAAGVRAQIGAYPGRRGVDKVHFLHRAETWYRGAAIALVGAASLLVLSTLIA